MPGETMTVIAPTVGATARELNRPMLRLKQAGRVRSVGMRHATRYFPMAREAPAQLKLAGRVAKSPPFQRELRLRQRSSVRGGRLERDDFFSELIPAS